MPSRRWTKRKLDAGDGPDSGSRVVYLSEEVGMNSAKSHENISSTSSKSRNPTSSKNTLGIVWYKWNDLRVKDHEPLFCAHGLPQNSYSPPSRQAAATQLKENQTPQKSVVFPDDVVHLHIVELPLLTGKARVSGLPRCSRQRAKFWKECVKDLALNLRRLSEGPLDEKKGRGKGKGCSRGDNTKGSKSSAPEEAARESLSDSAGAAATQKQNFFIRSGPDAATVLLTFIAENDVLENYDALVVYAHREFCIEELATERCVRNSLENLSKSTGKDLRLTTFWGAQTVNHIDDLGFDPSSDEMPLYKGEFNRIAKSKHIRPVLSMPKKLKLAPEVIKKQVSMDEQIDRIFSLHEEAACIFEKESEMELTLGRSSSSGDSFSLEVVESSSYGTAFLDGSFAWEGGESHAQEYLDLYFGQGDHREQKPRLWSYRGATESFAHDENLNPLFAGTRLSPWLAFGCISAREVVQRAKDCERQTGKKGGGKSVGKAGSTGARLHTELLFRDFLRFSALKWGSSLFQQKGPFRLGQTPTEMVEWQGIEDCTNRARFRKWRLGQTGFPFVDAGMRQLLQTGYMSHLHRQCCAAFLVRDLKLDWRLGAEHFESCLVDYTPDANWGNWAYRILQRPCLAKSRNETGYSNDELARIGFTKAASGKGCKQSQKKQEGYVPDGKLVVDCHLSTLECIAWPIVHDCGMQHTLTWIPELKSLPKDISREPWRLGDNGNYVGSRASKLSVKPYKDSPLWFCAANRANWHYEYWWLPGGAWLASCPSGDLSSIASIGYHPPLVRPLNLEIELSKLPIRNHAWGDTPRNERPHIRD